MNCLAVLFFLLIQLTKGRNIKRSITVEHIILQNSVTSICKENHLPQFSLVGIFITQNTTNGINIEITGEYAAVWTHISTENENPLFQKTSLEANMYNTLSRFLPKIWGENTYPLVAKLIKSKDCSISSLNSGASINLNGKEDFSSGFGSGRFVGGALLGPIEGIDDPIAGYGIWMCLEINSIQSVDIFKAFNRTTNSIFEFI